MHSSPSATSVRTLSDPTFDRHKALLLELGMEKALMDCITSEDESALVACATLQNLAMTRRGRRASSRQVSKRASRSSWRTATRGWCGMLRAR